MRNLQFALFILLLTLSSIFLDSIPSSLKVFLETKVCENVQVPFCYSETKLLSYYPLHLACAKGNEYLIDLISTIYVSYLGFDLHSQKDSLNATALHYAAFYAKLYGNSTNRCGMVEILLKKGARGNLKDVYNHTSLNLLASSGISGVGYCVRLMEIALLSEEDSFKISSLPPKQRKINYTQIPRDSFSKLSVDQFLTEYVTKTKPIVFENSLSYFNLSNWYSKNISNACGKQQFTLSKYDPNSMAWAKLHRGVGVSTIGKYIEDNQMFMDKKVEDNFSKPRIWDSGFQYQCPDLANQFTIPDHFAVDLRRVYHYSPHKNHPHPSIFVDPGGVKSGMHIDRGGTSFWILILEGEKVFRIVSKQNEKFLRYRSKTQDFDAIHSFEPDLFNPDYDKFPELLYGLEVFETTLKRGDVLYIPFDTAHQVYTPKDTIAFSHNSMELSDYRKLIKYACIHYQTYPDSTRSITSLSESNLYAKDLHAATLQVIERLHEKESSENTKPKEKNSLPLQTFFESAFLLNEMFEIKHQTKLPTKRCIEYLKTI